MNIVLTGSRGLLGGAIEKIAKARGHVCRSIDRKAVSWLDNSANAALFGDADILIHAAASTNVEANERDPDSCYRDNTLLTEVLAKAAATANLRFAFVSSTGIYGTHKAEPYHEFDRVEPTTHHHRSKWLAEQAATGCCPGALIVRTGWLFGGDSTMPKNFVARRIDEAKASPSGEIASNNEQRGSPSYIEDVATRLIELAELRLEGVFNCVNSGSASRFDYVTEIISQSGLATRVVPSDASVFGRVARVSNNEAAVGLKARMLGLPEMPIWQDALRRYLSTEDGLLQ